MDYSYFDYKLALSHLRSFNGLVLDQTALAKLFVYQRNDLLTSFQSSIFSDFKNRTKFKRASGLPAFYFLGFLKNFFIFSFMVSVSVFSSLLIIFSRRRILIFTGDKMSSKSGKSDFRLDPLYEALSESKVSFVEIVHTIPSKVSLLIFLKRLRPVIYLEAFDWLSAPFVLLNQRRVRKLLGKNMFHDFDLGEREFVRDLIIKYASATDIFKLRFLWLRFVLRFSGVRSIFSIDDVRHYNELVLVAKSLGINFIAIQHGHFTKYHVGWLKMFEGRFDIIKPNKIVVWSKYWQDELLRLGTYFERDEIIVGGSKSYALPSSEVSKDSAGGSKIAVLMPYETDAPFSDVSEYVKRIVADPQFELIFKMRTDLPEELQLSQYGLTKDVRFTSSYSIHDVLGRVSVVVGTYSTFLYDMVAELKPIGILETALDYGEGMVLSGLAGEVGLQTWKEDLLRLNETQREVLEEREAKLCGEGQGFLKDYLKKEIQNALSD